MTQWFVPACCIAMLFTAAAHADLALHGLFTDHMVLQRDAAVPVWGRAAPGQRVTVTFADQSVSGAADETGAWRVDLQPMSASTEPRDMTINTLTLRDVVVGDVWLASGQSNMWWPVRRAANAAEEIEAADHPSLRLYTVEQMVAGAPADDVSGAWSRCSPQTVADFSATAYYFGRDLHKEIDVPVGLVHASVRGTAIEVWMSRDALDANADATPIPGQWPRFLASWNVERYPDPDQHASAYWKNAWTYYDDYMARWNKLKKQGVADPRAAMPEEFVAQFDDHKRLEILLKNDMPGAFYNAMIAPLTPFTIRGVIWFQGESNALREDVTTARYAQLLSAMIDDWRVRWAQGDFPFLIVGLTNFQPKKNHFKNGFPLVREAQRQTALKLNNVGFVNTIDLGEANNIHAENKQDVGNRLARVALAQVYGRDVVHTGPVVQSIESVDGSLRVRFDQTLTGDADGFEVAGADETWHKARAEARGDAVVLTCDAVAQPVAVRYAWSDNPEVKLYNQAGLPAVPFREALPWQPPSSRRKPITK